METLVRPLFSLHTHTHTHAHMCVGTRTHLTKFLFQMHKTTFFKTIRNENHHVSQRFVRLKGWAICLSYVWIMHFACISYNSTLAGATRIILQTLVTNKERRKSKSANHLDQSPRTDLE